jgi:hypothetical protein
MMACLDSIQVSAGHGNIALPPPFGGDLNVGQFMVTLCLSTRVPRQVVI